ncbi:UNVERIFIED_CONTAM: hypothetical protein Sindi_1803700 [Sesamum indicum]
MKELPYPSKTDVMEARTEIAKAGGTQQPAGFGGLAGNTIGIGIGWFLVSRHDEGEEKAK